ncbi:ShlB/FhaC/HecB family hemolysin secretion/activation protein [Shewanella sp. UCD-FRSSP16_17]|uniref:ShlB/FhaC/HecB family hemolysin secretion/activation protein n=1 Tax=Shewanella sp. UCD-FRSSP16_17 TaxID=1853256 RepID=UPI0009EF4287|nr:ShlB/FhaC/HecB family hemolysin secretion/activation protein [Shewanella sp. UCD-FRSSP16_17]
MLVIMMSPVLALASQAPLTVPNQSDKDRETANQNNTITVDNIIVQSNAIFDESDPDAFFIHHWANWLHINTTEPTILDKLTFKEGEQVTQKTFAEAQRLLRAEPYLRDAKIYVAQKAPDADSDEQTVVVETWDNWSLLPTFSLSSSGGETKYSVGIKEDNLMGLGIKTRLKYQSNADRTGYKFGVTAPLKIIQHATVSANIYDNSDGQATHLYFTKPFYSLDTKDQYFAEYLTDQRIDTLRQNGEDVNEFEHNVDYAALSFGWLLNKTDADLSRVTLGVTQDKHQFAASDTFPDGPLPQNRDFIYPWIGYEYLQDDYQVFTNIHLINNNEDFNLGWRHYARVGFETNDVSEGNNIGYHFNVSSSRGYQLEKDLLLLNFSGQASINTSQKDFYNVSAQAEYFYKIHPKWTAYAKTRLAISKNNYLDKPFALGDDTGVRGYPNDYQYGDNQWLLTGEVRYYPNINLYQLAELGWATFVDIGQAFGGPDENNEVSSPIGSVGIGARVFSSKSSYGSVGHIDLAVPFTSGEKVDDWEWRFQVKNRF